MNISKENKSRILLDSFSKILKDVDLEDSYEINQKKNELINRGEINKNKFESKGDYRENFMVSEIEII